MDLENYNKYLAGQPINEELANLKAGKMPEVFELPQLAGLAGAAAEQRGLGDVEAPLTHEERIALREVRLSPGWPVVHKLLERSAAAYRRAAIQLSETDPLAKDLSDLWLSVKLSKELTNRLLFAIAVEAEQVEETHEAHAALGGPQA